MRKVPLAFNATERSQPHAVRPAAILKGQPFCRDGLARSRIAIAPVKASVLAIDTRSNREGRVKEKRYPRQSTADLVYGYNANGWLTHRFTRTGTGASTNGYFTTYGYDAVGNLTNVTYPAGTASITNWFDALNRLTNRLDGLGQTQYRYAVLGNGLRTLTEDGPWASDEVTVTNRYGLRTGLRIAPPGHTFTRAA